MAAAALIEMPEFVYVNDPQMARIVDRLFGPGVNSDDRCEEMLRAVGTSTPSEIFWSVFHTAWAGCDDTWYCKAWLLQYLRFHHHPISGTSFLRGDDRAFFDGLPDLVRVYRGCSWGRARGVSWTTVREVAERFAHGHRGIRVPWPAVASAMIPKSAIFGTYTEREESEVVIDPRRLRQLEVVKWS
jgi:hypothetical protein